MNAIRTTLSIGNQRWGLWLCSLAIAATTGPAARAQAPAKRVKIVNVQMIHDVIRNGEKGMLIRMNAEVDGLVNCPVRFAAYYGFRNGGNLKALPGPYCSPKGEVTSQTVLTPAFQATDFNGIELFIPLTELNIQAAGRHELRFLIEASDSINGLPTLLAVTGNYYFTYTRMPPPLQVPAQWPVTLAR